MSAEDLQTLLPTLELLDASDVDAPSLPIAVAVQEAQDLTTAIEEPTVRAGLLAVGLPAPVLDALPGALGAAREAQARWALVRDGGKTAEQAEREARGARTRTRLARACRWNLRERSVAMATLDAITAGDGVADLIQDLLDLAALIDAQPPAFAADTTFDPIEAVAAARDLARSISAGLSEARSDQARRDAKLLRDRAYTHLDDRVSAIRAAGRYAFADQEHLRRTFVSRYLRRRRRRSSHTATADSTADAEVQPPTEPPSPPEPA